MYIQNAWIILFYIWTTFMSFMARFQWWLLQTNRKIAWYLGLGLLHVFIWRTYDLYEHKCTQDQWKKVGLMSNFPFLNFKNVTDLGRKGNGLSVENGINDMDLRRTFINREVAIPIRVCQRERVDIQYLRICFPLTVWCIHKERHISQRETNL